MVYATIFPSNVKLHSDTIPAFNGNDGEVYAPANNVLRNIGFDENHVGNIMKKWRDDEVVSAKGCYFTLRYNGGFQPVNKETFCLSHKILPLALAKITITPTLKKEYPAVAEKLVAYQLECTDVLYKYFYNKTSYPQSIPVTKEVLDITLVGLAGISQTP